MRSLAPQTHEIVMLRRTIRDDAKKTKSCPYSAAIIAAQQNVNIARFAADNLTFGDSSENFVSDSKSVEDEFGAEPRNYCGKFMANWLPTNWRMP